MIYERTYRAEFFYKSMKFLSFNNILGDYLEFGCCGGMTFALAFRQSRLRGLNVHLYGFDSFQGLPIPVGVDVHEQWREGDMCHHLEDYRKHLRRQGLNDTDYTLVPGFYVDTLTEQTRKKLGLTRVALVYVDCDLYESTVSVLDFVLPLLQTGTILAFDDWYCFNGDPERGEQLALKEFRQKHSEIGFVDYQNFGWHGRSFIVKKHHR
jgi:hypothetical protein